MKNRFIISILSMALVCCLMLAGCKGNSAEDEEGAKAAPENAGTLVDKLYEKEAKNTIVSHTSLNSALALLGEGSASETRAAVEKYLGSDMDAFAEKYAKLNNDYSNIEDGEIHLANGLWVNKASGIQLKPDYKQKVTSRYDAEISEKDFSDSNTVDEINSWCSEKTNGLIKEIVDDSIREKTIVGANALYFNCDWIEPFDSSMTGKEDFTLIDGSSIKATMMNSQENIYLENDKATGFMKEYKSGLYFVGILPKEEGEFSLAEMQPEKLIESQSDGNVLVKVPKFKIEDSNSLVDVLSDMGLSELFDAEKADFSPMATGDSLYVDNMLQKTVVDVNERGTEAAAVTEFEMKATALPEEKETTEVYLNRPFAFAIYDSENKEFLFMGKIIDL